MRAWLLDGYNGVDSLRLADVPDPQPAAGEALVRISHAAINPADRYLTEKLYPARPKFPHILGREGVGTVVQSPAGSALKSGDRVIVLPSEIGADRWGTLAELVSVPIGLLVRVPESWSDEQAAGASIGYLTAYQALMRWGPLAPGYVLVTGASGGVGLAATHLGAAMGHQVIALTRGTSKRERLLEQGAAIVCDSADAAWGVKLREELGGRKVQLAIDSIGGALFEAVIDSLGMDGRVSCVGRLAGPVPEFNTATLFFRQISIGGVAVTLPTSAERHAQWSTVVKLLERVGRRPVMDARFAFEELQAAFARLSAGPFGKVVVRIGG